MKVILPNCRIQLTAEDIDFIVSVLRPGVSDNECVTRLLADEDTRDLILDDEKLFTAILERRHCLRISTHFYFYILVRAVFRKSDIQERRIADYVAEVLAEFSRTEAAQCQLPGGARQPFEYFVDLLAALQTADDTTRFYIRAHIGNHSLFLAGIFPDRIRYRTERKGAPNLGFYEGLGRTNFRAASDHRLARKYALDEIFDFLADRFETARLALNEVRDRLVSLGEPYISVDLLVKPSFPAES